MAEETIPEEFREIVADFADDLLAAMENIQTYTTLFAEDMNFTFNAEVGLKTLNDQQLLKDTVTLTCSPLTLDVLKAVQEEMTTPFMIGDAVYASSFDILKAYTRALNTGLLSDYIETGKLALELWHDSETDLEELKGSIKTVLTTQLLNTNHDSQYLPDRIESEMKPIGEKVELTLPLVEFMGLYGWTYMYFHRVNSSEDREKSHFVNGLNDGFGKSFLYKCFEHYTGLDTSRDNLKAFTTTQEPN